MHKRGSVSAAIEDRPIVTSFLQKLPRVERYYRYTLPLMPWAVGWRLPECDLVFSSSHCVAKGVTVPPGALHLCYCHTPMRYAWHMQDSYFHDRGWRGPKKWLAQKILARLREWDRRTAAGVTHFIANSQVVRQRIRECYGRDAVVIHPPVDTNFYCPANVYGRLTDTPAFAHNFHGVRRKASPGDPDRDRATVEAAPRSRP